MKIKYFAWIKEVTNVHEELVNANEIKNLDQYKEEIYYTVVPLARVRPNPSILRWGFSNQSIFEKESIKIQQYFDKLNSFGFLIFEN